MSGAATSIILEKALVSYKSLKQVIKDDPSLMERILRDSDRFAEDAGISVLELSRIMLAIGAELIVEVRASDAPTVSR